MASSRAKKAGIVLGVLMLLIVIGIALFDWNMLRGFVSHQVSERTERSFAINGDLDVGLSMTPRIRMERIVLGNAPWGSRPKMLSMDALEFRIRLWPLLKGEVIIPELSMTRPDILLETGPQGQKNWVMGKQEKEKSPPPTIGALNIQQGVVAFRDPAKKIDIRLLADTRPPMPGWKESSIVVNGTGHYKGEAFALSGQGGSLLSLRNVKDPYPLKVSANIGKTRAEAAGTITDPVRLVGINIDMKLQGDDLAKLYPIVGTPLPKTPPYRLVGHLRRQGPVWSFADFTGSVGDSDLSGFMSVDLKNKRPFMRGDLVSKNLDFDDLAGMIGGTPKAGKGETASPEQKAEAAKAAKSPRLLPDKPYKLDRLRAADADVKFRAGHIKTKRLPFDDLSTHLVLKNGVLTLKPLNFGVAGGNVVSHIVLDASQDPIKTRLNATVRSLYLKRLMPTLKLAKTSTGRIGGKAELDMRGNSIADMAASADGKLGLAMGGGGTSDLLLSLAQIHADKALYYFLGGDKRATIRCAVADFDVNGGLMKTDTLLIDTTSTNIRGHGTIDLGKERMHLTFLPEPKRYSLLSGRTPLYLSGRFKKPDFGIDKTDIAIKAGAAVALGTLLSPIAALLPLIDTPQAKDHGCAVLMEKAGRKPAKAAQ